MTRAHPPLWLLARCLISRRIAVSRLLRLGEDGECRGQSLPFCTETDTIWVLAIGPDAARELIQSGPGVNLIEN